eukprot:scaffold6939_cov69-Phaeocystis_antarctica.AAC.2
MSATQHNMHGHATSVLLGLTSFGCAVWPNALSRTCGRKRWARASALHRSGSRATSLGRLADALLGHLEEHLVLAKDRDARWPEHGDRHHDVGLVRR